MALWNLSFWLRSAPVISDLSFLTQLQQKEVWAILAWLGSSKSSFKPFWLGLAQANQGSSHIGLAQVNQGPSHFGLAQVNQGLSHFILAFWLNSARAISDLSFLAQLQQIKVRALSDPHHTTDSLRGSSRLPGKLISGVQPCFNPTIYKEYYGKVTGPHPTFYINIWLISYRHCHIIWLLRVMKYLKSKCTEAPRAFEMGEYVDI